MKTQRARRGRGEGSIFQRGDGLWVARVSLGYDGAGKRLRRTFYGATKTEVQTKLKEAGPDMGNEPQRTTVATWLHRWLATVKPTIQPGTYRPYERHVTKHIIPEIGGVKLSGFDAMHVQNLYAALIGRGMSPAMVRKIGTTLTIAFNKAVECRVTKFNPALAVRKPLAMRPEFQVLTPEQVAKFLKAADADRLYALYVLALDAGMRPGELFALTWADVDFERRQVSVTKSIEEIAGKLRVKEVKTKRGRRRIDIGQVTLDALQTHRRRMLAEGHAAGPVFCNTVGTYLRLGDVRLSSFKPIVERAGLPATLRMYDLRHTTATLLLLADENPKIVSERLGHATVQLTLDTYTHVLPTMQRRAADKMNAFLSQKVAAG